MEIFRSTARPCFLFRYRSVSGQSVVSACPLQAAGCSVDVLDANICQRTPRRFLSSSLPLTHTNLFPLPFPQPLFHFPSPFCSHQPSAAVRGYHSSKAAAASGSSGGQGSWSGPSFTRTNLQHYLSHHQQHPHHHPQSQHTSYAYCPAHTAVSTAHFLMSLCCSHLSEHFSALSVFLISLSLSLVSISGRYSQRSSYAHSKFSILPLLLSLSLLFNLPLFPTLSPLKPSLCISLSPSLLPLLYLFLSPLSLFSAT